MIKDILDDKLDESFWRVDVCKRKAEQPASESVKSKKAKGTVEPAAECGKEQAAKVSEDSMNVIGDYSRNVIRDQSTNVIGDQSTNVIGDIIERVSRIEQVVRNDRQDMTERLARVEEKAGDADKITVHVQRLAGEADRLKDRVEQLEEKSVDQAIINERLRRLEDKVVQDNNHVTEVMRRQEFLNARLMKFLDSCEGSRPYMLDEFKKAGESGRSENQGLNAGDNLTSRGSEARGSEVSPSKKGVRKTVLQYDIE